MTWRRFITLVRGLGPNSATVAAASSRVQFGSQVDRTPAIQDRDQAQATFVSIFGQPKRPA